LNFVKAAMHIAQMKIEQGFDQERLDELQEKRLKALISHCAANVPRYKGYRGMDELRSFRPITKEELRDAPGSFMADGIKEPLIAHSSSGSTGVPVTVHHAYEEDTFCFALEAHQLTEAGLTPFDLQARICDYRLGSGIMQKAGIFRRHYLSVQDRIEELYAQLLIIRAHALHCYPSIMAPLARHNLTTGRKLRFRLAFSASETVSPQARRIIAESFDCDMRDSYGSCETSWVAWECEKGGMHIHPSTIVEVVDGRGNPVGKGVEGIILVTPLWKRAMPLIRYRIGDHGSLGGRCSCGRGTKTLATISGREDDFITLQSGLKVSARAINLMDDVPGLKEYQIVQEETDRLVFRYCPSSGTLSDAWRKEIASRIIMGCHGEEVRVEFEESSGLARGRSGKLRTVVSKVRA